MSNLLTKIVTPAFITFNAHCWFAYAIVLTFFNPWVLGAVVLGAGIKEFYVDKHFEVAQSFDDNLGDFAGYVTGTSLAVLAHVYLQGPT
jgi:hypothetical protein